MAAKSLLSKKRFYDIEAKLQSKSESQTLTVSMVMDTIKEVLNFDPDANSYEPVKKVLEKKKEQGISSYQALNHKKYYEAHKEVLNKKRLENIQKKANKDSN